jgi:hypothetical protein
MTVGNARYGQWLVRAAATPAVVEMFTPHTDVTATAAALTGTTGTDGKVTLGVQAGVLYVENRLGSTQTVCVSVLAGS